MSLFLKNPLVFLPLNSHKVPNFLSVNSHFHCSLIQISVSRFNLSLSRDHGESREGTKRSREWRNWSHWAYPLSSLWMLCLSGNFLSLYLCIVLSLNLCFVDVSCDFAIGFLGFVVINDLLSFLYINSFENMLLFQKKKSLKENWIFSCMDWRTELRFELL